MVRPALWLMIRRSVTFCSLVKSLSGSFQLFRKVFTSSSRRSLPCSTSFIAATAATGLLMEPAWNSVEVVTGRLEATSANP